jgi:uncharacterized OB-fold protein
MNAEYARPLPEITEESAPYWEGLRNHALMLQHCGDCGKVRHYPQVLCDACFSTNVSWRAVSGNGKIHSWTIAQHAFHPGFKDAVPYPIVLVDLDIGVRINAPFRGNTSTLHIGLPVHLIFEDVTSTLTLPAFASR